MLFSNTNMMQVLLLCCPIRRTGSWLSVYHYLHSSFQLIWCKQKWRKQHGKLSIWYRYNLLLIIVAACFVLYYYLKKDNKSMVDLPLFIQFLLLVIHSYLCYPSPYLSGICCSSTLCGVDYWADSTCGSLFAQCFEHHIYSVVLFYGRFVDQCCPTGWSFLPQSYKHIS